MASDTYGEFSVILRQRTGTPCLLSTYEIIMQIRDRLKNFKGIFNVSVSLPNFVIHLTTVEQQLHVLSWKELKGPDYIFDIAPWTSEYLSLELPWVPPLHTETPSAMSTVKVIIPEEVLHTMPSPDFSYLMILELKSFYYSKLHAFLKCEEAYKQLYNLVQPFSDDVTPRIERIYQQSERYSSIHPTQILAAVADFGGSLNYEQLFISEEIFGLHLTMESIYRAKKNPISLHMYQLQQSNGKSASPAESREALKIIYQIVLQQLYPGIDIMTTHVESDDYISTNIASEIFEHKYKVLKPTTEAEAQAVAYYRFLKYATNILGHRIADKNWDILQEAVSLINQHTEMIGDFQYCVNDISNMISTVAKHVRELYQDLLDAVPSEKIPHIIANVDNLISLIEDYDAAAQHAVRNFKDEKKRFRSIKLCSSYPAKPDEP